MFSLVNSIIYYIGISFSAGTMMFIISRCQSIISRFVQKNILIQPYAFEFTKRDNILVLVLSEAPLIISAICIAFINSLRLLQIENISVLISSYIISILLTSFSTIYYSSKPIEQFFNFTFSHPQNSALNSSRFILLFSLFQAPLIINIISVVISVFHVNSLFSTIIFDSYNERIFVLSSVIVGTAISSIGSIKGISYLLEAFFKSSTYYNSKLEKIFVNLFVFIGLIDAPFIFSFILNLFIQRIIMFEIKNYIFISFVILIFSIVAYYVSLSSGKTSAKALSSLSNNDEKNRAILSVSLLSQILLDSRILYMFIVLIIFLLKMNLLK